MTYHTVTALCLFISIAFISFYLFLSLSPSFIILTSWVCACVCQWFFLFFSVLVLFISQSLLIYFMFGKVKGNICVYSYWLEIQPKFILFTLFIRSVWRKLTSGFVKTHSGWIHFIYLISFMMMIGVGFSLAWFSLLITFVANVSYGNKRDR